METMQSRNARETTEEKKKTNEDEKVTTRQDPLALGAAQRYTLTRTRRRPYQRATSYGHVSKCGMRYV